MTARLQTGCFQSLFHREENGSGAVLPSENDTSISPTSATEEPPQPKFFVVPAEDAHIASDNSLDAN